MVIGWMGVWPHRERERERSYSRHFGKGPTIQPRQAGAKRSGECNGQARATNRGWQDPREPGKQADASRREAAWRKVTAGAGRKKKPARGGEGGRREASVKQKGGRRETGATMKQTGATRRRPAPDEGNESEA